MKYIYSLKIHLNNKENKDKITNILKVSPTALDDSLWELKLVQNESDSYIDFINHYLDILENKYDLLKSIDINREDISIWMLYEYDNQCNMEFLPSQLLRIGEHGITLCISCWETGSIIKL